MLKEIEEVKKLKSKLKELEKKVKELEEEKNFEKKITEDNKDTILKHEIFIVEHLKDLKNYYENKIDFFENLLDKKIKK